MMKSLNQLTEAFRHSGSLERRANKFERGEAMADYIDRQAVIDMFQRNAYDDWNQGVSTTWANAFSECADMVEDIPPADVEPLRHGKWIETEDDTIHGYCSVCGWESHLYEDDVIGMPYCPNCGARMDGD